MSYIQQTKQARPLPEHMGSAICHQLMRGNCFGAILILWIVMESMVDKHWFTSDVYFRRSISDKSFQNCPAPCPDMYNCVSISLQIFFLNSLFKLPIKYKGKLLEITSILNSCQDFTMATPCSKTG